MSKIDNKWLRREFNSLNERFFDNRIQNVELEFAPLKNKIGIWYRGSRRIKIDVDLIQTGEDYIIITLLHEMAHASLESEHYEGYPCDEGHGTRFQAEIWRLVLAGAYDGLL